MRGIRILSLLVLFLCFESIESFGWLRDKGGAEVKEQAQEGPAPQANATEVDELQSEVTQLMG